MNAWADTLMPHLLLAPVLTPLLTAAVMLLLPERAIAGNHAAIPGIRNPLRELNGHIRKRRAPRMQCIGAIELICLAEVDIAAACTIIVQRDHREVTAIRKGTDVDKPRNLAKSVTVE